MTIIDNDDDYNIMRMNILERKHENNFTYMVTNRKNKKNLN